MILATVNTYDQHLQVISSILKNGHLLGIENFWLGASNLKDLNTWTWQSIGTPLGYKNWSKDEPQSNLIGQNGCMIMGMDESWYSVDCNSKYYFICERTSILKKSSEPMYL
ncbi:GH20945 [Drosophila grimshawi]|uniref:GH20945 n=2 Tax=Drosophila grimshawi TaxID=7222 RepID=B4J490_DROGR|nr:GH20945 [Drosophila grimshawi]